MRSGGNHYRILTDVGGVPVHIWRTVFGQPDARAINEAPNLTLFPGNHLPRNHRIEGQSGEMVLDEDGLDWPQWWVAGIDRELPAESDRAWRGLMHFLRDNRSPSEEQSIIDILSWETPSEESDLNEAREEAIFQGLTLFKMNDDNEDQHIWDTYVVNTPSGGGVFSKPPWYDDLFPTLDQDSASVVLDELMFRSKVDQGTWRAELDGNVVHTYGLVPERFEYEVLRNSDLELAGLPLKPNPLKKRLMR